MEAQARENSNQVRNDFKPFATGEGANVVDQLEYEKSGFLKEGFKKGMARSSEINKAIRQGSSIAAAVARFAAEKTGEDIFDNGDIGALSRQIETAISSVSSLLIAEADGLPDALTARFTPKVKELKHGLPVHVRAKNINITVTPTFNTDETGAKAIVKGNNLPLAIGDIAGAGHWLEMQYDEALDKWILQNPAKGISPSSGVPVGTIEYFASAIPPAGYLKADGVAVGRTTYPELFAAIGTAFGEGDGSTTFNLPDLIDRFAQGSSAPGQKIEAGLPNITAGATIRLHANNVTGAFVGDGQDHNQVGYTGTSAIQFITGFDASRSNHIYGASNTVQPPALTLLPCIKAFDAATNPSLIDITELANDVADLSANKLDKSVNGKAVKYITETYNDGMNWYRKWSDGWLEQGGMLVAQTGIITLTFLLPFSDDKYCILKNTGSTVNGGYPSSAAVSFYNLTATSALTPQVDVYTYSRWYACGQGAQL